MNASDRRRSSLLVLMLALAAIACAAVSCSTGEQGAQPAATAPPDTAATAERGAYLATIAGCHDCHTPGALFGKPDFQRALAGSDLGWQGPWGTSYAHNLTPDPVTGLGSWTEDDIVRTLQTGMRRDGSGLLPPMPWPSLAHMTPRDLHSIAKYLKSIPPITHPRVENLPPGKRAKGAVVVLPAPPPWDATPAPAPAAAP